MHKQLDVVSAKAKSLEKEVKLLRAENERLNRANQTLQRYQASSSSSHVGDKNLPSTTQEQEKEFVIRKRQRE